MDGRCGWGLNGLLVLVVPVVLAAQVMLVMLAVVLVAPVLVVVAGVAAAHRSAHPPAPIPTRPPAPPAHPCTHAHVIGWTHTPYNLWICLELLNAGNRNLFDCVAERTAQCVNMFNVTKRLFTLIPADYIITSI